MDWPVVIRDLVLVRLCRDLGKLINALKTLRRRRILNLGKVGRSLAACYSFRINILGTRTEDQ